MPRREKNRLERLSDIATHLKRARDIAHTLDTGNGNGRSQVAELRNDLDRLAERLVKALQAEATAALSLHHDEREMRQDS